MRHDILRIAKKRADDNPWQGPPVTTGMALESLIIEIVIKQPAG